MKNYVFFIWIMFNINNRIIAQSIIFCDKRSFYIEIVSHLAYNLSIGSPMANEKCRTKIVFFSEKKVVGHTTFLHLADRLTVLIYDYSLVVLDPVTT